MKPRIIFVDPNFLLSSPSMRSIVLATPFLQVAGIEVEIWSNRIQEGISPNMWVRLPYPKLPAPLNYWIFSFFATAYRLGKYPRRSKEARDRSIVFSTGYYSWIADFSLIQFSNLDWFKRQIQIGVSSLRDLAELLRSGVSLCLEFLMANNRRSGCLLPVSRAVATDFKKLAWIKRRVEVLPNARNQTGFSPAQRIETRSEARFHHGYGAADPVFTMTAMGHLRRKGFNKAVLALQELRNLTKRDDIRFLFIGGTPPTLETAKVWLDQHVSNWHSWVKLTGMVNDVPLHLSAADAFLFPSYSEAFSLAEIEASSMGLRLYLTPHHGSEMILKEGVNGRLISWDPIEIAKVLQADLEAGKLRCHAGHVGEAHVPETYAARLIDLVGEVMVGRKLK